MIKVELLRTEGNKYIYGVVDYITGERVVRFEGEDWLCLSFLTSMTSPVQIAMA